MASVNSNARDLDRELEWFARILDARLRDYFGSAVTQSGGPDLTPPDLGGSDSPYARFLIEHDVSPATRLVILLGLTPHIRPHLLDVLWTRNEATGRGFTEFGGAPGVHHGGFLPTGETAAFLLAGDDLATRFEAIRLLDGDQLLARLDVLRLGEVAPGEPQLSGMLMLSREYLRRFTSGVECKPVFSVEFPARRIHTDLSWQDLILPPDTLEQLEEIRHWMEFGDTLLGDWGMRDRLGPGFTSLFHGPSGTGKTLSACLLGKRCDCDVYKIDLSMIVSKYIGETEKNLAKVFDLAEHKGWILFFDEADALFGRRTKIDSSHDRFANQEISFLLQRIEDFPGVVILASNLKINIDDAFLRRFQSIIHFPIPKAPERARLWTDAIPRRARLEEHISVDRLADQYDLPGGTIVNVVRYASLKALSRGGSTIVQDDLEEGIRRELRKEGRTS